MELDSAAVNLYLSSDREGRVEPAIRDRLLDAAEARARRGGYHGFSFREIAADVGVKSASVHHHYPTKADLGAALVRRYADRARDALGEPSTAEAARGRVIALFRAALERDDKMCLCGLFGAERDTLPPEVARETAAFFRMLLTYLERAQGADWRGESAAGLVARLEGALLIARTLGDPALFDAAVD